MYEYDSDEIARLRIALARISRMIERQVSSGDLTRTQISVLGSVARRGPLGVSELAGIEGLNPTMLSRVLTKLEAAELVERTVDEADRRAVRVEATASGTALYRRLREERSRLLATKLELIPAESAARILAALPALEEFAAELSTDAGGS